MIEPRPVTQPLGPIDLIRLQLARRSLVLSGSQLDTLVVLVGLSGHLKLAQIGETTIDCSRTLVVDLDRVGLVEISTDGALCPVGS